MKVNPCDDCSLRRVQRARRGHRASQARLLREYQDVWYRFSFKLLGNEDAARDATQEVGLRFLAGLPGFRGESRLKTWSLGIALNVCREMQRQRVRAPRRLVEHEAVAEATGPVDDAVRAEQHEQLDAQLAQLPARQREAVTLRYFEQLTLRETAAAMDCALGTAKATLAQALSNLRRNAESGSR